MWFNCSIWLNCCLLLWWTTVRCACFPRRLTPVVDAIHKSHAPSTICPVDLKSAMQVDLKVLLYRKPPQPLESAMMDFFAPWGQQKQATKPPNNGMYNLESIYWQLLICTSNRHGATLSFRPFKSNVCEYSQPETEAAHHPAGGFKSRAFSLKRHPPQIYCTL